ncbi:hypothetical protein BHE97_01395 [Aeromicrobium sp. PE09-221]|uniref:ABC transporter substrate-binding protein n=1 Tax=Aeromicrobium sp. PE09-221 TaxID=1898043 RepID=UPI000B3E6892|nr:ABC transporter substrate-binding protein [Aeromicrobium sp. PE09-221]OUZ12401.1 hypothetical protein BHE97_01395 [Aeromicrobium sp. PE09-221]
MRGHQRADHGSDALLSVAGLRVTYGGSVVGVQHVDLTVDAGESVALLGANGAGKSTILRSLGGLLSFLRGKVARGTKDLHRPHRRGEPDPRRVQPTHASTPMGDVSGGPGVDVDNKVITIGSISATSGPAAALSKNNVEGMRVFWEAFNDRGGIDGWTVDFDDKDAGYQTQLHVQSYNELKDQSALLTSFGSPTTKAIQGLLARDDLISTPQSMDSIWSVDPTLAPLGTPYSLDVANGIDYVTEGGEKDLKVGIVYQNDELGADGIRGFEAALDEYEFEDAGRQAYKAGDTDFTAQVQSLKSSGADVVVVVGLPSASGPIVGTAASQGFTPQWLFFGPAFIEQLMTSDGTPDGTPTPVAQALEGTIVTMFAAPWGDEDSEGMKQLIEDRDTYAPAQNPSVYFSYGYAVAMLQSKILEKAIEEGDLSREGISEARHSLGLVDLLGLVPDVSYGEDAEPPSRASLIQVIDPSAPGFLRTLETNRLGDAAESMEVTAP